MSPVSLSSHGSWLERTHNTIVASFSRDELRQVVQFALGVPLDSIAADKPLDVQVFDLLLWTTRTGRTLALIRCLLDSRPLNRELAAVAVALENGALEAQACEAAGQPASAAPPAAARQHAAQSYSPYSPGADATTAWQPSGGTVPLHKPLRTQNFIGRAAELGRLLAELQPGRTVTLCGPGGIGKTALAAEAIWTLAPDGDPPARFPDGIFFHTFYRQPQAGLALGHDGTRLWRGPTADAAAMLHARRWRVSRRRSCSTGRKRPMIWRRCWL